MPEKNLTPADEFTEPVTVPTHGTIITEANFIDAAVQSLTNQAHFLRKRTPGAEAAETVPIGIRYGAGAVDFTWDSPQMEWRQNSVSSAGVLFFELTDVLPKNCKLTSLSATVIGAAGHSALPATPPQIVLYRKDSGAQGNATSLGTEVDPSGSVGAYEVAHAIELDGLTEVIAHDSGNRYFVTLEGETGTDSAINFRLLGLHCTVEPA